jgi:hypothetical protein
MLSFLDRRARHFELVPEAAALFSVDTARLQSRIVEMHGDPGVVEGRNNVHKITVGSKRWYQPNKRRWMISVTTANCCYS